MHKNDFIEAFLVVIFGLNYNEKGLFYHFIQKWLNINHSYCIQKQRFI